MEKVGNICPVGWANFQKKIWILWANFLWPCVTDRGSVVYSFPFPEDGRCGHKDPLKGENHEKNIQQNPTFDIYHLLNLFGCV